MHAMKKTFVVPLLVILAASLLCSGCEIKFASASEEIYITPSAARVLKGDSVAFKAEGGYSYRWSLKEPDWGSLSSARGPKTVYTSRYDPRDGGKTDATLETQFLFLESYIAEAGTDGDGTTTNGTITVLSSAEAQITHVSRCDTCCDDDDCDDED